ncbi:MAG: Cardiolipin synthase B [Chlamydiia bacterium]|nr:Cardiolipin synthase B [Chlamydiia bacterium]
MSVSVDVKTFLPMRPSFENQVGIGRYKENGRWGDLPLEKRVEDVFFFALKVVVAGVAIGAIAASCITCPLAIALIGVICIGLIVDAIHTHQHKGLGHQVEEVNEGGPALGQWSENSAYVTQNGAESMRMKHELIAKAEKSIEISGSYCGGQIFDQTLGLIGEQLQAKPELQVKIISNLDLLNESNTEKLQELADRFPDRFFACVTTKQWMYFPEVKTEENHTKLLVIDGVACITGGTGLQDMLSREGADESVELTRKEQIMGKGARDMDVVVKGPVAKTMRAQFYQLLDKWVHKTAGERIYGSLTPFQPATRDPNTFELSKPMVQTNGTMITSSSEHATSNECKLAYLQMIRNAQKSIVIANMCFNQPEIVQAVKEAAERGVQVTVITNTDNHTSPFSMLVMGAVNRHYVSALEGTNAQVFEYRQDSTLYHKKVMVIDEVITTIGSFNLSLHCADTEDEDILIFDSPKVAEKTMATLEVDMQNSRVITYEKDPVLRWVDSLLVEVRARITLLFTAYIFQ